MSYDDYSPQALLAAGRRVCAALGFADPGSITWSKGDQYHTYGYHRGAAYLSPGAYSLDYPRDRAYVDAMACSALDLGVGMQGTIQVTSALRALWYAGQLPGVVAEFGGTLDGQTTYSVSAGSGVEEYGSWDDSHLTHPHISGWRDSTNDDAGWDHWADAVIAHLSGAPIPPDGTDSNQPPPTADLLEGLDVMPQLFHLVNEETGDQAYIYQGVALRQIVDASYVAAIEKAYGIEMRRINQYDDNAVVTLHQADLATLKATLGL